MPATQPGPSGTTAPPPNPLGTYTPVPAVDRPIGYTMSTPSRPARRARLGGAAGGVLAIAYLVFKAFLIGHVATSVVGGPGGSQPSTQLSDLRGAATVLTVGFAGATPNAQASMLQTFDDALRNIPLSGQADSDRTSALAADEAFESALTDGHNVPAAQAAHIAAVNQLAHDLGGSDVLSLTTGSS